MVLVTGANGFVGGAVVDFLANCNSSGGVVAAVRHSSVAFPRGVNMTHVGDLRTMTDWSRSLSGVSAVVHCAARVHVICEKRTDPKAEFSQVNVEGTATLARQAAAAGVRRFIFLSSIKVHGELSEDGLPFRADDLPNPQDPYSVSKCEAEDSLRKIATETGMPVVIIRPPLVYGLGVKANFQRIMRWLAKGLPLPLAGVVENRRSLVGVDNLVDLIVTCLRHPSAVNQSFLVSDGEDLSTAMLLRRMAKAQGKTARLFYVPSVALKIGATLVGRRPVYDRLCGSLQVDISKTRSLLGWSPPVSVDEGLRRAFEGFRV